MYVSRQTSRKHQTEENVEKIFDGLDDSGDQSIDFEEFKVEMIFIPRTKYMNKIL